MIGIFGNATPPRQSDDFRIARIFLVVGYFLHDLIVAMLISQPANSFSTTQGAWRAPDEDNTGAIIIFLR